MSIEMLSLIAAISLAFIGYIVTYWNNIQMAKRAAQLELVNKRIGEFYGPLYVATRTSRKSYTSLLQKLNRQAVFTNDEDLLTEEELAEWRVWLESVFMPTNELIEKLIVDKAYLIQEEEMPDCLLQFITHVSGYRVVLHKWESGESSEVLSINRYPTELDKYAADSYKELKAKQLGLIGKSNLTVASKP